MVKMTFTFDDQTVETLRRTASRLKKPQSVVVREAIRDFAARSDRLNEEERKHRLQVFDRVMGCLPKTSREEAAAEIVEIRRARRSGGRRTRSE
jgi:hypothetical protein